MEAYKLPGPEKGPNPPLMEVAVSNTGSKPSSFIEANTIEGHLEEIRAQHIIPVFHRDNTPVISQVEFIEVAMEAVRQVFPAERITAPQIRLSHPVMGRIPAAKGKPASELEEWEKTLYYERMAFLIEVPSIRDTIEGQALSLSIGGVRAHHLDNLSGRRDAGQHFRFFIGFKVSVCTNLCVFSDGFEGTLKVGSLEQLRFALDCLIRSFDAISCLKRLESFRHHTLSEGQFAHLLGRCRMYPYLPLKQRRDMPELLFGDQQVAAVCRDYYRDESFCRTEDGSISLWRLYNLFTAANRSSYIDQFLHRSVAATGLVESLAGALENRQANWFLPDF